MNAKDLEDIKIMYRDAKNKKKQIRILATLYEADEDDIKELLGLPFNNQQKRERVPYVLIDRLLQNSDLTVTEIAKKLNCSYDSVRNYYMKNKSKYKREGIMRKNKRVPYVLIDRLLQNSDLTVTEIAKKLNCSYDSVRNYYMKNKSKYKREGIMRKNKSKYKR